MEPLVVQVTPETPERLATLVQVVAEVVVGVVAHTILPLRPRLLHPLLVALVTLERPGLLLQGAEMAVLVLQAVRVLPIHQVLPETRETMALWAALARQALWEIPVVQVIREPLVRMVTLVLLVLLVVGPLQVAQVTPAALVQMATREPLVLLVAERHLATQATPEPLVPTETPEPLVLLVAGLHPVLLEIPEVRHRQPTQTSPLRCELLTPSRWQHWGKYK